MTEAEAKEHNLKAVRASKSVATAKDCSFINGGLYDNFSGGPATAVGDGRFYQVLRTEAGQVVDALVVDCDERAVTRVMSGFVENSNYVEDSCGGQYGDRFPLLAPTGTLTLTEGETLQDFERIAEASGKAEIDGSLLHLRVDQLGKKLPKRDQIDFLCGCERLYPNLPEVTQ